MVDHQEKPLVGIDTGGTFTDLVLFRSDRIRHCKVLSTPDDPSRAIAEGLKRLGLDEEPVIIVHGTTVGTNAVLEGKGARVAYLSSAGFADVLTLGRQEREQVYSLQQRPLEPPVPDSMCLEVSTRVSADGSLRHEAEPAELAQLRQEIEALGVESLAINLLFSFLRPELEQGLADQLGSGLFVSCSSQVLPEIREYERGIATWLNASVGPVIDRYLKSLTSRHPLASVSVMQSSGASVAADQAASQAVQLLLSGPAGGLAAARMIGTFNQQPRMLTLDMGGTSTDVALLNGQIPLTNESRIGRWPLTIRTVDIHTIGAGGGSIARVDRGGLLLVGPESAGAAPGPACYGQGGEEVTVTDANMVLGRIPEHTLLGGYLPLDGACARTAMGRLAARMGCSRLEAAAGVVRMANEHMARALRVISVERGHDPRDYRLFCFGGAGGLHACELAELLDIREVTLPPLAGVLSALGMLASQPGRESSMAVLRSLSDLNQAEIEERFETLEHAAMDQLELEGKVSSEVRFNRQLEMRYLGQSATITLAHETGSDLEKLFHDAHRELAGHALDKSVELVNVRISARAPAPLQKLPRPPETAAGKPDLAKHVMLSVQPGEAPQPVPIHERRHLATNRTLRGPAIISEPVATAWIPPGWEASQDQWGNLQLCRSAQSDT